MHSKNDIDKKKVEQGQCSQFVTRFAFHSWLTADVIRMKFIEIGGLFIGMTLLGLLCSGFVYGVIFAVLLLGCYNFGLSDDYSWIALSVAIVLFVTSLVHAIFKAVPDITRLTWNSGTVQEAPSEIYMPPKSGGYMWNVNPFGHETLGSIVKVISGILCFGPELLVTAFTESITLLKK